MLSVVISVAAVLAAARLAAADRNAEGEAAKRPLPVIRISVDLIQIDVVVTDKKGRHVTDLGPTDFEIREDGRLRTVSNISYVRVARETGEAVADSAGPGVVETATPLPSGPPRTILFVVDDNSLSLEGVVRMREALRKVVDELPPTDRLAFISTGGAVPDVWPPGPERAELRQAINALRYRSGGRHPVRTAEFSSGRTPSPFSLAFSQMDSIWYERFVLDSLGAMESAVRLLRDEPGRKALIVASEGFTLPQDTESGRMVGRQLETDFLLGTSTSIEDAFRKVGDSATRASVVIHVLDPRGLQTAGLTAEDPMDPGSPEQRAQGIRNRQVALRQSQWSLRRLPDETGGLAITDNNDLSSALRQIVTDLGGYYLVGYEPEPTTFAQSPGPPRFRKISIKVKRKGLEARTRKGFYAVSEEALAAAGRP